MAYERAIELADNAAEIALLTRRRDELSSDVDTLPANVST